PAGDQVARPGELREARLEPADRAHAARLHQELGEIPHREHPVREDAGVAGVARELVVGVHGVGITRGGGIRLQVLAGDRTFHERRELLPHGDGLGVEAGNHVLREMRVLREKKTGSPAASTASVSSTAKSSMPFEPGFSERSAMRPVSVSVSPASIGRVYSNSCSPWTRVMKLSPSSRKTSAPPARAC